MVFCCLGLFMFVVLFVTSLYVAGLQWLKAEQYQKLRVELNDSVENSYSGYELKNSESLSRSYSFISFTMSAVAAFILSIGGAIMWANS